MNTVLALPDQVWLTVHIQVAEATRLNVYDDLATWHEESLAQFRPDSSYNYRLVLSIDGQPAQLELGRGNGGGLDADSDTLTWTQSLTFACQPADREATLTLDWGAVNLRGTYSLDLADVSRTVEEHAY